MCSRVLPCLFSLVRLSGYAFHQQISLKLKFGMSPDQTVVLLRLLAARIVGETSSPSPSKYAFRAWKQRREELLLVLNLLCNMTNPGKA